MNVKYSLLLLSLIASANTFAANIKVVGSIPTFVPNNQTITAALHPLSSDAQANGHYVQLMKIELSPAAQDYLAQSIGLPDSTRTLTAASTLGATTKIALGMNNVPVLDQGMHGTCVTFTVTGAIDAALYQSNYVSQTCNLELGKYLEQLDPNYYSGWEGTWNETVLTQAQTYGVMPMTYQKSQGCGGLTEYPLHDSSNTGNYMTNTEFLANSDKTADRLSYKIILSKNDAYSKTTNTNNMLKNVKQALGNNHRVVFGVLLDVNYGYNGALGKYKVAHDSWVLTPGIISDVQQGKVDAGHAMVITGFDDNAAITDSDGAKHTGVLTLRNSWGKGAGDHGDYYMSYDYFRKLTMESIEVIG